MKIVKKSKLQNSKDVEHFEFERKILSSLNHPFIAKLRFAFQTERRLYIVTDFYPGGDLLYHIRNKQKFTEKEAKIYLAQVVIALEYLHKKNILYRTLSPESITLDSQGYIRLSDFSLSTVVDYDQDRENGTGFIFNEPNSEELLSCLRRTLILYLENPQEMRRIKTNAMRVRFNWSDSCKKYVELYKEALKKPKW